MTLTQQVKESPMLWYCRFTWYPGTTAGQVRERVIRQHALGTNHPEVIKGWYNLAGGGAGFLLIDTEDPQMLNDVLEPYMDILSWDVHAVYELPYHAVTGHFSRQAEAAGKERFEQMVVAGVDPFPSE